MKWVGITGSWKLTSQKVEDDVRREVSAIINQGNGIVTGGALGVDFFAMDEVVRHGVSKERIRVYLPVTLPIYTSHYLRRADEEVISHQQATSLIRVLEHIHTTNPESIIENYEYTSCNKESYFARNGKIVDNSDELYAFQVNNSEGTQDTIDKARLKGIEIKHFMYES